MTARTVLEKNKSSSLELLGAMAFSIAALVASARIQIPMFPVPITLQTAIVLILPCLLGMRAALVVMASYFALGAAGLPVFANAIGAIPGPAYFIGPTGGYLVGFVLAVLMMGMIFPRRNWSMPALFGWMLAGHALILACGAVWLGFGLPGLGLTQAIALGVVPFMVGSVLKSFLALGAVSFFYKNTPRRDRHL